MLAFLRGRAGNRTGNATWRVPESIGVYPSVRWASLGQYTCARRLAKVIEHMPNMSDHGTFRVAAVQAASVLFDGTATTTKACYFIERAAQEGCDLIALPEAYIPVYPYWVFTTAPVPSGLSLYKKLYRESVDVPGPLCSRLCQAAKRFKINVIAGINLRETSGPHRACLFNAQLFIDRHGGILGVRRKLTPINNERGVWGVGDGSDLQVHHTDIGWVGGLICGEHTMATFRYALAAMGEQIHVANWPGLFESGRVWDIHGFGESVVRSYGMMNQVFVVNSCSIVTDELMHSFEREGVVTNEQQRQQLAAFKGFSSIISPFGTYLSGPDLSDKESLVIADINLEDIIEAKYAHNPLGYHDRWDVAHLVLNRAHTSPTTSYGVVSTQSDHMSSDDMPLELRPYEADTHHLDLSKQRINEISANREPSGEEMRFTGSSR